MESGISYKINISNNNATGAEITVSFTTKFLIWALTVKKINFSDKITGIVDGNLEICADPGVDKFDAGKTTPSGVQSILDNLNKEFSEWKMKPVDIYSEFAYSEDLLKYKLSDKFKEFLNKQGYFNTKTPPEEYYSLYVNYKIHISNVNICTIPGTQETFDADIFDTTIRIKKINNKFALFKFIYKQYIEYLEFINKKMFTVGNAAD